jgi:hypothetical protein
MPEGPRDHGAGPKTDLTAGAVVCGACHAATTEGHSSSFCAVRSSQRCSGDTGVAQVTPQVTCSPYRDGTFASRYNIRGACILIASVGCPTARFSLGVYVPGRRGR